MRLRSQKYSCSRVSLTDFLRYFGPSRSARSAWLRVSLSGVQSTGAGREYLLTSAYHGMKMFAKSVLPSAVCVHQWCHQLPRPLAVDSTPPKEVILGGIVGKKPSLSCSGCSQVEASVMWNLLAVLPRPRLPLAPPFS